MKKIKLFLAAMAAMITVGTQAQSWTAPTIQGDDPVSGQQYKVMNVGAGTFLDMGKAWFGWSTTAILSNTGVDFTLTADGDNWKFFRTENQGVFTSGNGIVGDAMHVDNTPNTYAITKLANGYYQIHDVNGGASACWGHKSSIDGNNTTVTNGVVAHADADADGWMCEWVFIKPANVATVATVYQARLKLYNLLNTAQNEGANTDAASLVYNNADATVDELNAACTALNLARAEKVINDNPSASKENPVEITDFVLVNPDFEISTPNGQMPPGWTITIGGYNCGQQNRKDTNPDTGLYIQNFIEAWHWSALTAGVIAQTVNNLPEGTYVLECDASVCHDDPDNDNGGRGISDGKDIKGAYLFIKSSLKTEQEPLGNRRLDIQHYSVSFSHGGSGEVQFGLMATNEINANWLSADNFKIFYAGGVDLSIYEQALADAVAAYEATEATADPTMYATVKGKVDGWNTTYSTSKAYQTAIDNVHAATDYIIAYSAAVTALNNASYSNVTGTERQALITAINTVADENNYVSVAGSINTACSAFIAAAPAYDKYVAYKAETVELWGTDLGIATPTSAAEATVAVQNLNIAQYNKVASDYPYSLVSKIGDFSTWTGTAQIGTPREAGTPNSLDWEHWSGVTHPYYEQDNNGYNDAGGWTIQYTKTTTLPAGSYVVKVAARSSAGVTSTITCTALPGVEISLPCAGNNTRGINTDGEASWDENDTFISTGGKNASVGGTGAGWQWRFLPFTLAAETEVTMTFYAEASSQYQWMSIGDGELLSATNIATAVAYNETANNTIEDEDVANVTMTRKIKEGYNTVVLPFDCTLGQVEAAFGTGTEVYEFSENSDDANAITVNFNKVAAGTISANVPVLIKATAASNEQVFNGVQVVAPTADVNVAGKNIDFVGTYAPIAAIAEGDYFIGNGAIYKSAGNTSMKAFRAYLKVKNANADVKLFIDGIETGISEINGTAVESGAIYNLAGQRVSNAQKGIYIVNGKKVIIK